MTQYKVRVYGVFVSEEKEPRASFFNRGHADLYRKREFGNDLSVETKEFEEDDLELYSKSHYFEGISFLRLGGFELYMAGKDLGKRAEGEKCRIPPLWKHTWRGRDV